MNSVRLRLVWVRGWFDVRAELNLVIENAFAIHGATVRENGSSPPWGVLLWGVHPMEPVNQAFGALPHHPNGGLFRPLRNF
jgi:hypothetical protein